MPAYMSSAASSARRLPNVLTKVTQEEMFLHVGRAWTEYMGGPPTKEKICMLVAQSAFETGWWQYMHCFNFGNAKSVEGDGRDYTFFRCWELVSPAEAARLQAHPTYGSLVTVESTDAQGRAKVWLAPDHPGCRFRAYETLEAGVMVYFADFVTKYSDDNPEKNAWGAIVRCDPQAFVHALKMKKYFTGDEAIYTNQVASIYKLLLKKPFDMSPFPSPVVAEDEQARNARITGTMTAMNETGEDENS